MNENKTNRLLCAALAAGICLLATAPAVADAWAQSSGSLVGSVDANGEFDQVVWNELPEYWLLHAEAEALHMCPLCPPPCHDYDADTEAWDPTGDGFVWAEASVPCADASGMAMVGGGGSVDVGDSCFAHRDPASGSAAAGLAQHDDLFWIEFAGDPNAQPDSAQVTVLLEGGWALEGGSLPDESWWADVLLYGEIYDANSLAVLASGSEYHYLEGPDYASDANGVTFEFDLELEYDRPYALRYWVDAESSAEAPEPAALALLLVGTLLALRRRRR